MRNNDERDLILAGLLKGCHESTEFYGFDNIVHKLKRIKEKIGHINDDTF